MRVCLHLLIGCFYTTLIMIRAFTRLYLQVLAGLKASGFSFMPLSLKSVGAIAQFLVTFGFKCSKVCIQALYYKLPWAFGSWGSGRTQILQAKLEERESGWRSPELCEDTPSFSRGGVRIGSDSSPAYISAQCYVACAVVVADKCPASCKGTAPETMNPFPASVLEGDRCPVKIHNGLMAKNKAAPDCRTS